MLKKCGITNAYEADDPVGCSVDLETTKSITPTNMIPQLIRNSISL